MSNDIPHRWRQHSDFLYLTGFEEGDAALVMTRQRDGSRRDRLYVRERDADRELWDGPRTGVKRVDGAFALEGVDVKNMLSDVLQAEPDLDWVIFGDAEPSPHHPYTQEALQALRERFGERLCVSKVCEVARLIKEPAEVDLMQAAADITAAAFDRIFHECCPGMKESALDALLEYESRWRGATRLAYPPVIAGGVSANILHYVSNNHILQDGELVLVDAGCELHSYASDVTRTFPVNGKFSEPQKQLYNAVLAANEHCISMCRQQGGTSLQSLNKAAANVLAQELVRLGFAKTVAELYESGRIRKYFPHSIGHYLGMDVHDTHSLPTSLALEAGMVITIEPGLYIPHDDTR